MPDDRPVVSFEVDGTPVDVTDDGASLLVALRDKLGLRSPKDGCSPQGQCGCCTVLVDGQPRVACVTPARRVRGRSITTLDGLDAARRDAWGEAFCATGASQCGFCTPGIVLRLEALRAKGADLTDPAPVEQALLAHLCRCTGWRTILDAAAAVASAPVTVAPPDGGPAAGATPAGGRDLDAAGRRATIEGRAPQRVGPEVALGRGGFADDTAPPDALVAVPDGAGGWAVAETLDAARAASGKVQGRRTTAEGAHPIDVPPGDWAVTLRTTWVEPAYLELDASWSAPGGTPATPLANGGAFGAKRTSPATEAARRLADEHGRPVRVVLAREDAVRLGPKRPPLAAGVRADGTGVVRVARTPGIAGAIAAVAPGLVVEEVDVPGPPTSTAPRAAGWAEALALLAAATATDAPATNAAGAEAGGDIAWARAGGDIAGTDAGGDVGTNAAGAEAGGDIAWAGASGDIAGTDASGGTGGAGAGTNVAGTGAGTNVSGEVPEVGGPAGVLGVARGDGAATVTLRSPDGAVARATVALGADPSVAVTVACGAVLDEVVVRSYAVGAAHMALGWVASEGLVVDAAGEVHDLTIRSFGVLRAVDTPPIAVTVVPGDGPPVNGSDAVFAAVAAAAWLAQGTPPAWPTGVAYRPRTR